MPPSDRWPVGLVAGVARALAAFAAAVRGRSSSRRWRARSACRAVCALPRLRAAVAPVVWLAGFGDEGCFVLQRPRMGDEHAPSGAQIAAVGGDSAQTARKSQGGEVSPASVHKILCTKNPRPENTGRGRRGTAPARKTGGNEAQNPLKCHQKAPALTRGGQRGIPNPKRPADWPEMGYQMSSRCLSVR